MQRWALWCVISISCFVVIGFGAVTRAHQCAAPWQPTLLDDAALDGIDTGLPAGWTAGAPGVRVGAFTVAGGHSVHMLGIGTWLGLPSLAVKPAAILCVRASVLADSPSATRIRTRWVWTLADGGTQTQLGPWQMVRAWGGTTDRGGWSTVIDTSVAPALAQAVTVRFEPASDDRIYLDQIAVRGGGIGRALPTVAGPADALVTVRPWPAGMNAAVSFSYDFESAMGGLVHSRSVDDPNAALDPIVRAKRMRAGLWQSLALYAPYGYRATYYVNGYNFLTGNPTKRTFMGNPTFAWATKANGWQSDIWATQPWFSVDPYGPAQLESDWYFADLLAPLRAAGHSVQSHTFAHFYGGYATPAEWRADSAAWNALAAEQQIPPATSLAFPWSSSAGMQYANWDVLAAAGITSLTRTAWNPKLPQYHLVDAATARCVPLPGHESITVCPDYYLTVARTPGALALLADIRGRDGMIDFWAHTEEVTTPAQIAAWKSVVDATAAAGDVWVAPLADIAARQRTVWSVRTAVVTDAHGTHVAITNPTDTALTAVALQIAPGWRLSAEQPPLHEIPAHGTIVVDITPE